MDDNIIIKCNNGFICLTEKELAFLRAYKTMVNDKNFKSVEKFFVKETFGAKAIENYSYNNINSFLNFLFNPKSSKKNAILFFRDDFDDIIEMIQTFVRLSCQYSVYNGRTSNDFYRIETKDGLSNSAQAGKLSSIKSSSYCFRMQFFNKDSIMIKYRLNGFVPYLDIDDILNKTGGWDFFEGELVFPPFVDFRVTDETFVDRYTGKRCLVCDVFYDEKNVVTQEDLDEATEQYFKIKDKFLDLFFKEIHKDIRSEELCSLSKVVLNYIEKEAKMTYQFAYQAYCDKYKRGLEKEELDVVDKNNLGIFDTVKTFVLNPSERWSQSYETLHIWMLQYLVDSNFIPKDVLMNVYFEKNVSILKNYLMCRTDDTFKNLSAEECDELFEFFNIAAGYRNDDYESRISAVNSIYERVDCYLSTSNHFIK